MSGVATQNTGGSLLLINNITYNNAYVFLSVLIQVLHLQALFAFCNAFDKVSY